MRVGRCTDADPRAKSVNLLGTCAGEKDERVNAVLLMERAFFTPAFVESLREGPQAAFSRLETIGQNDVYTWVLGWQQDSEQSGAHSKMTLICPAGDEVIAKYSAQERRMILETPEIYKQVTKPWIDSIPKSKTTWVHNILDGVSERESVLFRDDDPKTGFVIVPDLKWDRRTLGSLYLVAIVKDASLTNMRDLTKDHVPLLKKIQAAGAKIATEKYGLPPPSADGVSSSLRCFLHYMPTYLYVVCLTQPPPCAHALGELHFPPWCHCRPSAASRRRRGLAGTRRRLQGAYTWICSDRRTQAHGRAPKGRTWWPVTSDECAAYRAGVNTAP